MLGNGRFSWRYWGEADISEQAAMSLNGP